MRTGMLVPHPLVFRNSPAQFSVLLLANPAFGRIGINMAFRAMHSRGSV